jgi:hypothetical protein
MGHMVLDFHEEGSGGHQFLATVGVLGGAVVVTLVCIWASATTRPKFS